MGPPGSERTTSSSPPGSTPSTTQPRASSPEAPPSSRPPRSGHRPAPSPDSPDGRRNLLQLSRDRLLEGETSAKQPGPGDQDSPASRKIVGSQEIVPLSAGSRGYSE